jgi:Lon protease-like protein
VEAVGVLAHIDDVDAEQAGILRLRCTGGQRFRLQAQPTQRDNGLWVAQAEPIAPDVPRVPGPAMLQTVNALAEAIKKLQAQDRVPFAPPYRLDDAGWVANRWCELLPVPIGAKQKLMELDDPMIRLSLVDGFLRDKKVVVG